MGCDLIEIGQSARSLNDATVDLRLAVESGQMVYSKDADLLRWSFANAKTTQNSFGEIKLYKEQSGDRIDPVDALVDAWKLAFINKDTIKYDADKDFDEWFDIMRGGE